MEFPWRLQTFVFEGFSHALATAALQKWIETTPTIVRTDDGGILMWLTHHVLNEDGPQRPVFRIIVTAAIGTSVIS